MKGATEVLLISDRDALIADEPAWLEFLAMQHIVQLRKLNPDHWLVKAVQNGQPAIRDERTADMFTQVIKDNA